jgi:hypothetical protein
MRLRLEELQRVVKRAVDEERATESLRTEVNRVLGSAVIAEGRAEQVAEAANEKIDVLERTGRASRLSFKPSVMVRWLDHTDPGVRKFAARVVPEKFLAKMVNDRSHAVRATVARRVPIGAVSEMLKKFPSDDQVRLIYKQRKLAEAGLPKPKVDDEPFDMYGEERLGDAVKQDEGDELSEQWYRDRAFKFMQDYGGNIEDTWEEVTAHRYAASLKATSGVEIDEAKLLKAIKELIEEREERAMDRSSLKETLAYLRRQEKLELIRESTIPTLNFDVDPVLELVEGNLTPATYLDEAKVLFRIQESTIPPGIRKHRLGERNARWTSAPVIGKLPHGGSFRSIDEKALDMYCEAWNGRQMHEGEPLRLEWSTHPGEVGKVSFNVTLR